MEDINNIPTAGPAAALVNSLFSGFLSDYLGNRPLIIVANMAVCMSGNVFLAVWKSPVWLKFVGYIFITTGLPAQSQTIAWLNEVCQGNGTLRGLIVSIGNTLVYAINAWALVLLFPAVDGKRLPFWPAIMPPFLTAVICILTRTSTPLQVRICSLCRLHRCRYRDRLRHFVHHPTRPVSSFVLLLAET